MKTVPRCPRWRTKAVGYLTKSSILFIACRDAIEEERRLPAVLSVSELDAGLLVQDTSSIVMQARDVFGDHL